MQDLSVYIHVPYCKSKCAYCDFVSYEINGISPACSPKNYLNGIRKEISIYSQFLKNYEIKTVFFGGGTPSLLDVEYTKEILRDLRSAFHVCDEPEITTEANPESLDEEKLLNYKAAGINRISVGVQSFDGELLKLLNRIHTTDKAKSVIGLAKKIGFNVSLDLIYGIPHETEESWKSTVEQAIELNTDHVSCYGLSIEKGTRLYRLVQNNELAVQPDEDYTNKYRIASELLSDAGFCNYEISNWAKAGKECEHNKAYWQRKDFLGLGPAAHSHFAGLDDARFSDAVDFSCFGNGVDGINAVLGDDVDLSRGGNADGFSRAGNGDKDHSDVGCEDFDPALDFYMNNTGNISDYVSSLSDNKLPIAHIENVSNTDRYFEKIMLGLRTRGGVSADDYKKYLHSINREYDPSVFGKLKKYVVFDSNAIVLTEYGKMFLDYVIRELT